MIDIDDREKIIGDSRLENFKDKKKALLVGCYFNSKDNDRAIEHLNELEELCDTYGVDVIDKIPVILKKIVSATFIGSGKALEIEKICQEKNIEIVIFDDEISPHQQRNLEKVFKIPVIDRTELILGVFAKRAKTNEAKIQVDLAKYKYQFPRLKRMWTHLSRQRMSGKGGGHLKGEGERQIEIDRRILKRKISKLKKDLEDIKNQRVLHRKSRERKNIPTFAIIGYTNAGKSTLLKLLTDADVFVEDKLFATLDTTTRKFTLPNKQGILLTDTVGFIRKLPHTLVASFKSTLEEVFYSDILIHIIDISSELVMEKAEATFEVLKELNSDNKPIITVLNKIDKIEDPEKRLIEFKIKFPKVIAISCKEKIGIDDLIDKIIFEIKNLRKILKLKIPQSNYSLASMLIAKGTVISQEYVENDILLEIEIPKSLEKLTIPYQIE